MFSPGGGLVCLPEHQDDLISSLVNGSWLLGRGYLVVWLCSHLDAATTSSDFSVGGPPSSVSPGVDRLLVLQGFDGGYSERSLGRLWFPFSFGQGITAGVLLIRLCIHRGRGIAGRS